MKPIEYAPKLSILGEKEKRIKIIVGGRGSTKSTFVADYVISRIASGELWCCAREHQNTIEESVHRLLLDEIDRLEIDGISYDKAHIYHQSGGRNFYRGLARNPSGIKSMLTGVDGLWIEEGETLGNETLRQMSASLRRSATDAQRIISGESLKLPEIWITMNRGSSKDPIAIKWLERAEKDLARCGVYEDDQLLVVQINYDEIPRKWFLASGLETERADDEMNLSEAAYRHKWHGDYNDTVENSIILPSWFDACIDAHVRLGIKPSGIEVVSHDPSGTGSDSKGLAYRHGVVFLDVLEKSNGDVNEGCDWALDYAIQKKVDYFVWDADGMGEALRRQIDEALSGKKIEAHAFHGGSSVEDPSSKYNDGESHNVKTNEDTFKNLRAQKYIELRDRINKTYIAVTQGKYIDPDELISFSSKILNIRLLRSEICRVPEKQRNLSGKIQIASKQDMRQMGIPSPNMADSVMMSLMRFKKPKRNWDKIKYANYAPI